MKKISLSQNKFALVDDEDYVLLRHIRWAAVKSKNTFYVKALVDNKSILMHRFLLNPPKNYQIDHKDGNGLNNCKINLRVCTRAQNGANRKLDKDNKLGYKGVFPKGKKYYSRVIHNGKSIYLGMHKTKEDAARAYDQGALKFYGEYAKTNKMLGLIQ